MSSVTHNELTRTFAAAIAVGGRPQRPIGLAADLADRLPADLRQFYEICGGLVLFEGSPGAWSVHGPDTLVPASPRLLTDEIAAEVRVRQPDDLTNNCYVIAERGPGATDTCIVIDLHPERLGRCYDAFWDSYGIVGSMPVVALTFTRLLAALVATAGTDTLLPDIGADAYDNTSD